MAIGLTQMNSLVSSQATLKNLASMSASKTALNGRAGVLAMEIKIDKGATNVENKETELASIDDNLENLQTSLGEEVNELNEKVAADSAKIQEEQAQSADETAKITTKGDGAGQATQANADRIASDITAPQDTVEINGAVKTPEMAVTTTASEPTVNTSGTKIDVTV